MLEGPVAFRSTPPSVRGFLTVTYTARHTLGWGGVFACVHGVTLDHNEGSIKFILFFFFFYRGPKKASVVHDNLKRAAVVTPNTTDLPSLHKLTPTSRTAVTDVLTKTKERHRAALKILSLKFSQNELSASNCSGKMGKVALDPNRLALVRSKCDNECFIHDVQFDTHCMRILQLTLIHAFVILFRLTSDTFSTKDENSTQICTPYPFVTKLNLKLTLILFFFIGITFDKYPAADGESEDDVWKDICKKIDSKCRLAKHSSIG